MILLRILTPFSAFEHQYNLHKMLKIKNNKSENIKFYAVLAIEHQPYRMTFRR